MRNGIWTKGLVLGIIILFVGTSVPLTLSEENQKIKNSETPDHNINSNPSSNYYILDPGDILFEYNVQTPTGDNQCRGVYYDGTYFYVTGGGGTSTPVPNKLYFFQSNGNYIGSVNQPTPEEWGWRDIASDGTYMYSGSDSSSHIDKWYVTGLPNNPVLHTVGYFTSPLSTTSGLTYDPSTDHFWTALWDSNIYEIDRNGNIINSYSNTLSIYGMAWDSYSSGGPWLWVYSQTPPTGCLISQFNPSTGQYTGLTYQGVYHGTAVAGGLCFTTQYQPNTGVLVGCTQDDLDLIFGMEIEGGGGNQPPNTPNIPSGPTSINTGESGTYITSTNDPDGDQVQYRFDWDSAGLHEYSSWTNLVPSGQSASLSHSWSSAGTYIVKAQARDEHGLTSNSWSTGLTVVVGGGNEPYYFVHITDIHVGTEGAKERFTYVRNCINNNLDPPPAFVVISGDCTHWGFVPWKSWQNYWQEFNDIVSGFEMPAYVCWGNHDWLPILDPDLQNGWGDWNPTNNLHLMGLQSGGFDDYIEGWHWVWSWLPIPFWYYVPIIDWLPEGTGLTSAQLTWLGERLNEHPDYYNIVFMHHPVFWDGSYEMYSGEEESNGCINHNRDEFINLCRNNAELILGGHTHEGGEYLANSNNHIISLHHYDPEYHGISEWGYWDINELKNNHDLPMYAVTGACSEFLKFRKIDVTGDNLLVHDDWGWYEPGGLKEYKMETWEVLLPGKGNRMNETNLTIAAARLHVYDSYGNHVGINNSTGDIDFEISGAYYENEPIVNQTTGQPINWSQGELINIMCNKTDSYIYQIDVFLNSTLNLTGTFIEGNNVGETATFYSNVTVYAGSIGKLYITNGTEDNTLYLDDNGDGIVEREIKPTIIYSPPEKPSKPIGNTIGVQGKEITFSVNTTDPEGDQIYYLWDWGDGNYSSWQGPYDSGEKLENKHTWSYNGIYKVRVKAMDNTSRESNWSEPFTIQIVTLQSTIVFGLISERNETGEFITFKAELLVAIPSNSIMYSSGELFAISYDYTLGFVGKNIAIGIFDAAIISESTSSTIHPLHERLLNHLYKNLYR